MGIIGSLRETLEALEPDRRAGKTETAGSYWCDDCDEPMRFERAPDSASCAC